MRLSRAGACCCCGWTDLMFISRRSVFFFKSWNNGHQSVSLSTTSGVSWPGCPLRALKHVHVHFRVRFMLNIRHHHRDTLLFPCCFLRLSFSVEHLFFSSNCSATPRTTLCLLFRFIINAFLFPRSFRDNPRQAQCCGPSGVLLSPTPGSFKAVTKGAQRSV